MTNWKWTADFFQIVGLLAIQFVDTKIIPGYGYGASLSVCLRYSVGIVIHMLIVTLGVAVSGTMQNKIFVRVFKPLTFIGDWSGTFLFLN